MHGQSLVVYRSETNRMRHFRLLISSILYTLNYERGQLSMFAFDDPVIPPAISQSEIYIPEIYVPELNLVQLGDIKFN